MAADVVFAAAFLVSISEVTSFLLFFSVHVAFVVFSYLLFRVLGTALFSFGPRQFTVRGVLYVTALVAGLLVAGQAYFELAPW